MDLPFEQKLKSYKTPEAVKNLLKSTRIVFLVGVTAAGKDTVMRRLIEKKDYHHIVSHTTRKPRANHGVIETEGVDYHFIDLTTAEKMIDNGGFVEAKMFSGNVYGTSVAEIQMAHDEGKIGITDLEVQGVAEYCALADTVTPIFLLPPDFATWQKRLELRHADDKMPPEEIRKRLETALIELREALEKPYFEYVVNNDLELTVQIADEIAHGSISKTKNDQARAVAQQLLADLEKYLNQ